DEALVDGRFVGRYWSATGSIKPERHLDEEKRVRDLLPTEAFSLRLDDRLLDRNWRWVGAREHAAEPRGTRHVVVELKQESLPFSLKVHTRFDGSPFLVRWLEITNGSDGAVSLSSVAPFAGLLWWVRGYGEYLPADGSVFTLGYNTRSRALE